MEIYTKMIKVKNVKTRSGEHVETDMTLNKC